MNITLESDDADTYLYLREGDARSRTFPYENDYAEPGNTAKSQMRQTLAAGSYTVEATTYDEVDPEFQTGGEVRAPLLN